MRKGLLYDSTLCIGCRACEQACAEKWGLPYSEKTSGEEKLSAHKLTTIVTFGEHYVRRLCMHCAVPTCASVCPVGALQKTDLGPVIYDESRCMGCRYCMLACPYQVPTYEWDRRLPRVKKCDLCYARLRAGKPTACSEACPTGATMTGDWDSLVREAQRRIAAKPFQYYPRIYGLHEAGGASVLILSAVPFEQLGMKVNLPQEPLPLLTARVLRFVPDVVSIGSVLLGGIYWITHRREEVAASEGKTHKDKE